MALPIRQTEPAAPRPTYLRVADAAVILGCNPGHLSRRCRDELSARGLAKKFDGEWHVHANADMRLRGITTQEQADLEEIGKLHAEGVRPAYVATAERRRAIVQGFPTFSAGDAGVNDAAVRYCAHLIAEGAIAADEAFAPRTLFAWRSDYEKGGLRALVPGWGGGKDRNTIGGEAWKFFLEVKNIGHRISVAAAWKQTLGYIRERHLDGRPEWSWPKLRAVQARYSAEDAPLRDYADLGPNKFRARYLPKIARSYDDLPAGDVFCGDERTLDVMVRVPSAQGWRRIRPKVTAWLDVRSRRFIGFHVGETANSDTILSSFRDGCEAAGTLPLEVIVDNGEDYKKVGGKRCLRKWDSFDPKRLQTAFERLKIVVHYALVRHPWSKIIESHFRTLKEFDQFLAGFWGGKPDERPHDADAFTREELQTPLSELHTLDELRALFAQWLAAHHEQGQTGDSMFGLCPRQAFEQFFTTNPRRVTPETLRAICAHLVGPVKVGRDGVRWDNIRYGAFNEQVWRMQGREVWLLVDPVEADRVTLCDQHGSRICVAESSRNRGATREEVRAANAAKRRFEKVAKQYAGEARAYLMKSTTEQIIHRRMAAARATQVPDASLPPPPDVAAIRLTHPVAEAETERVRKASGAEAIAHMADLNRGAAALNSGCRRVDFAQFADDTAEPVEEGPVRRVVNWSESESQNE